MTVKYITPPIGTYYHRPHPGHKIGAGPARDMYAHAKTESIRAFGGDYIAICSMNPDAGPFFPVHIGSTVREWLNQTGAWKLTFDTLEEAIVWARFAVATQGEPT